jgi:hypothetical protein
MGAAWRTWKTSAEMRIVVECMMFLRSRASLFICLLRKCLVKCCANGSAGKDLAIGWKLSNNTEVLSSLLLSLMQEAVLVEMYNELCKNRAISESHRHF